MDLKPVTDTLARIAIIGAGYSGCILAYCLQKIPNLEVTVYEQAPDAGTAAIGAALNLNPNAIGYHLD